MSDFSDLSATCFLDYLANHVNKIPQVAKWLNNEWGYLHPSRSYHDLCIQLKERVNFETPPIHIVALDGEKLLGVSALKPNEMKMFPQREFWLGSLFVVPEYRGLGIATQLEKEITTLAQSLSISTLYLQTEALDGGLYSKLGWVGIEEVNDEGITVLVMQKQL